MDGPCGRLHRKLIIAIIIHSLSTPPMPSPSHTAAVQSIYTQHHSWLYGWLKGRLSSTSDAADLAHDTFVRILAARNAADIREPRDYLITIARGLVIDRYRRRAIEQAWLQSMAARPEAVVVSEEEKAVIIETLLAVDKTLASLGMRTRKIFMLTQIDGLTYQQAADQLGLSISSIKKHMIRALTECSVLMATL